MTPEEKAGKSASVWKEYQTPEGKKYYHNTVTNTTQWTRPPELDEGEEGGASSGAADGDGSGGRRGESSAEGAKDCDRKSEEDRDYRSSKKDKPKADPVCDLPRKEYASKEEAMEDFKSLLNDKVTSHKMTWSEVLPDLQIDVRFKALKSTGEKKNVFENFIAKKQRDWVDQERIRKKTAKDDFNALLRESSFITHTSRFRDIQDRLSKDPRFNKVESERERVELFEDHILELEKKEKEKLKAARSDNLANFRALLSEVPELTSKMRWIDVKSLIKDDPRYLALEGDDKYRLDAFDEYMSELATKEAEEKEIQKEMRRAAEKEQRIAFNALMQECHEQGVLKATTRWKELKDNEDVAKDDRFRVMVDQSKTRAQELFEDFIEELLVKYKADRPKLKEAYKAAEELDISQCSLEGFEEAMKSHQVVRDVADEHIKLFYHELVSPLPCPCPCPRPCLFLLAAPAGTTYPCGLLCLIDSMPCSLPAEPCDAQKKMAQEEVEKKEKRQKRAEKDFARLLSKYVERGKVAAGASYEVKLTPRWSQLADELGKQEAEKVCGERSAWQEVADDRRPELFDKVHSSSCRVQGCAEGELSRSWRRSAGTTCTMKRTGRGRRRQHVRGGRSELTPCEEEVTPSWGHAEAVWQIGGRGGKRSETIPGGRRMSVS
eukprot:555010-Hanusia_phi.AAC.2